eukprot:4122307-Lingulodinium_polyedra.AAC.1
MKKLRSRFKFGKWRSIPGDEGDYAGRTVQQARNYSCKVRQAKFILERLEPINIPKGGEQGKKVETSAGEKAQLRA